MKVMTLKETIAWMDKVIFEGTEQDEDFWSNFSDARMHLGAYADLMEKIQRTFVEEDGKHAGKLE